MSLQAALLDLGPNAAVAGRSAAALLGLRQLRAKGRSSCSFLVAERMHKADGSRAVERVTCRSLDVIEEPGGFRCTSAGARPSSIWRGSWAQAAARTPSTVPCAPASRRCPSSIAVLQHLRHRGRPGMARLDALLADSGGTTRLERLFLQVVRRAGLPRPRCQVTHRRAGRFVARADFTWEVQRVIAEVEGQVRHASPAGASDRDRATSQRAPARRLDRADVHLRGRDPAPSVGRRPRSEQCSPPAAVLRPTEARNPLSTSGFVDSLPGRVEGRTRRGRRRRRPRRRSGGAPRASHSCSADLDVARHEVREHERAHAGPRAAISPTCSGAECELARWLRTAS